MQKLIFDCHVQVSAERVAVHGVIQSASDNGCTNTVGGRIKVAHPNLRTIQPFKVTVSALYIDSLDYSHHAKIHAPKLCTSLKCVKYSSMGIMGNGSQIKKITINRNSRWIVSNCVCTAY
jgi:hypothetical protein